MSEQESQEVKDKGGRPTKEEERRERIAAAVSKMTPETINKMKEAFAIDASIEEACFYAEISIQTYYNWIDKNPDLLEEFNRLRQRPVLAERREVVAGLQGDKHFSFAYLKSKRKKEFSEIVGVEHSGGLSNLSPADPEDDEIINEAVHAVEERLRSNIVKRIKNKSQQHEPAEATPENSNPAESEVQSTA